MDTVDTLIRSFEMHQRAKVIYVTVYGSKLFGTDTPDSDTDYKGIFIPSMQDVLLKRDIEHYTYTTNTQGKNDRSDIDLQLYSIYKWFDLLKKGETRALDQRQHAFLISASITYKRPATPSTDARTISSAAI